MENYRIHRGKHEKVYLIMYHECIVMNHLKFHNHLLKILNVCSNAHAAFFGSLVHSIQDRICEWITCLDYYL